MASKSALDAAKAALEELLQLHDYFYPADRNEVDSINFGIISALYSYVFPFRNELLWLMSCQR